MTVTVTRLYVDSENPWPSVEHVKLKTFSAKACLANLAADGMGNDEGTEDEDDEEGGGELHAERDRNTITVRIGEDGDNPGTFIFVK